MRAGLGRQPAHPHREVAGADDVPQALQQGGVADELGRRAHRMLRVGIAQHRRLDGHAMRNGGLQQVGMEGQHALPVGRGAFGKHRHAIALRQCLRHLVHHAQRVALAGPLDEQRAHAAHQPAHHGPPKHVSLGDESRLRAAGMQRRDVQPRNVVGHHQRGTRPWVALHHQAHAQRAQHAGRPALDLALAAGGIEPGEAQPHDEQALGQLQQRPQQPPGGARRTHTRKAQAAAAVSS